MGKEGSEHVLIFPCPAQGHVGSMVKLGELLALQNLHVTFLNTEYIQNRLSRFGDIEALSTSYPTLHFKAISDCYEKEEGEEHPGFGDRIGDIILSISLHAKPLLRDVIVASENGIPKISCIIIDGIFGNLATDLAAELQIPLFHFRAASASSFWSYFSHPNLIHSHELPIRGDEDMDRVIKSIPGMENVLRCRDLPSFFRPINKEEHLALDSVVLRTQQSLGADALILNTFEELDEPLLSQMRLHFPKIYTLGPLHHHLNVRKSEANKGNDVSSFKSSVLEVERSCMAWLDAQPQGSVIYVSFGSCTPITKEELMEFLHGLVNSKKRFLWVMRPGMVVGNDIGDDWIPAELVEETKERGFMVGWAPQEEVLAHKAVGGFLTHSGWNSTLESLVAGVPMICWPYFADQQINSRFVSEVWKIGLDMKDVCDRQVIENMINDLMVHGREEFLKSAQEMAKLAHKCVSPGGSSYSNLHDLIHYIKSASQENI